MPAYMLSDDEAGTTDFAQSAEAMMHALVVGMVVDRKTLKVTAVDDIG